MSRAKNLAKLQDEEKEGKLGYVFAVSGPGKQAVLPFFLHGVKYYL